jgi:hypothetical protein
LLTNQAGTGRGEQFSQWGHLLLLKKLIHFCKDIIREAAYEWSQYPNHGDRITLLVSRDDLLLNGHLELALESSRRCTAGEDQGGKKKNERGSQHGPDPF